MSWSVPQEAGGSVWLQAVIAGERESTRWSPADGNREGLTAERASRMMKLQLMDQRFCGGTRPLVEMATLGDGVPDQALGEYLSRFSIAECYLSFRTSQQLHLGVRMPLAVPPAPSSGDRKRRQSAGGRDPSPPSGRRHFDGGPNHPESGNIGLLDGSSTIEDVDGWLLSFPPAKAHHLASLLSELQPQATLGSLLARVQSIRPPVVPRDAPHWDQLPEDLPLDLELLLNGCFKGHLLPLFREHGMDSWALLAWLTPGLLRWMGVRRLGDHSEVMVAVSHAITHGHVLDRGPGHFEEWLEDSGLQKHAPLFSAHGLCSADSVLMLDLSSQKDLQLDAPDLVALLRDISKAGPYFCCRAPAPHFTKFKNTLDESPPVTMSMTLTPEEMQLCRTQSFSHSLLRRASSGSPSDLFRTSSVELMKAGPSLQEMDGPQGLRFAAFNRDLEHVRHFLEYLDPDGVDEHRNSAINYLLRPEATAHPDRVQEILTLMLGDKTDLYFHRKPLGPQADAALASALDSNSMLKSLNLRSTQIASIPTLAFALRHNISLVTLNLEFCELRDPSILALAESLRTNATLQSLHLRMNLMTETGAVALFNALAVNSTLSHIDLRYNTITDPAGLALAAALDGNRSLTSVNLDSNCLTDTSLTPLADAMLLNPAVIHLSLRHNQFSQPTATEAIDLCLSRNIHNNPLRDQSLFGSLFTSIRYLLLSNKSRAF